MKRAIGEIRKEAGITQKTAAAGLGIGRSTWGQHERAGKRSALRKAMLETIKRITKANGSGIQIHIADLVHAPARKKPK